MRPGFVTMIGHFDSLFCTLISGHLVEKMISSLTLILTLTLIMYIQGSIPALRRFHDTHVILTYNTSALVYITRVERPIL
ncbi:hypothetical protein RU639_010206 [Aspergillus parasiticus]